MLSQGGGPAAREPGTPILPGLADSAASRMQPAEALRYE